MYKRQVPLTTFMQLFENAWLNITPDKNTTAYRPIFSMIFRQAFSNGCFYVYLFLIR